MLLSRINKLIVLALAVALALYIVILNTTSITVFITRSNSITANAGVILIATFGLGVLATALVAIFFGIKAFFRERHYRNLENQRKLFYQGMLSARSALAAEEWAKAQQLWEAIIKKDPTNIIARLELSRSLEGAGEISEALKVVDAASVVDPKNIEILFRGAELNLALNNKTAAIDNLALILYNSSSKRAAILARNLSEELGRIDDALEYHARLETISGLSEQSSKEKARLEFKKLLQDSNQESEEFEQTLKIFSKKHPDFVPVLETLAARLESQGQTDQAAEYLVKAAKISGLPEHWQIVSNFWIKRKNPERALAAARAATKETRGNLRFTAELELVRNLLELDMLDEAGKTLEAFPRSIIPDESPRQSEIELEMLKSIYLIKSGKTKEASERLSKLYVERVEISDSAKARLQSNPRYITCTIPDS